MCIHCETKGMVAVDEGILDILIIKSGIKPEDLKDLKKAPTKNYITKAAKPYMPGEKELYNLLTKNITKQLQATAKQLTKAAKNKEITTDYLLKSDFFKEMEGKAHQLVNETIPTLDKHLESIYKAGKEAGFKELDMASFWGPSDQQALFYVKNYNFDLIKNFSNDLTSATREHIWNGVFEGKTIPEITKEIKQLNIEPIKSGGRMISPDTRAQMIARTESMRATNTGTLMSYKNYGITLVDIPESGTEGDWDCDCPDIVAGSPYPIDDIPEGGPPFHTNCTHTVAAHVESAYDTPVDVADDEIVVIKGNT